MYPTMLLLDHKVLHGKDREIPLAIVRYTELQDKGAMNANRSHSVIGPGSSPTRFTSSALAGAANSKIMMPLPSAPPLRVSMVAAVGPALGEEGQSQCRRFLRATRGRGEGAAADDTSGLPQCP